MIWFFIMPFGICISVFTIIFVIFSDTFREISQMTIPYTLNRTFFHSVESDAFYFDLLPTNFKEIVYPCLWEGGDLLTTKNMSQLVSISQRVDDDLKTALSISGRTNLTDIIVVFNSLKDEITSINKLQIQIDEIPNDEFDVKEILKRLNSYTDCSDYTNYSRKFSNDNFYNINQVTFCGGVCKARLRFVFSALDCLPSDTRLESTVNWTDAELKSATTKCLFFVKQDGTVNDYTDAITPHADYEKIRNSIIRIANCDPNQDPGILKTA